MSSPGRALEGDSSAQPQPDSLARASTPEKLGLARWFQPPWRDALLRRMLALADALSVVLLAFLLAVVFGHVRGGLWAVAFLPLWLLLAKLFGLYDHDKRALRHLTVDEIPNVALWAVTGTVIVSLASFPLPARPLHVPIAVFMWVILTTSALLFRAGARWTWRRIVPLDRTLIVGKGELAEATRRKIELFPDMHVVVVGELAQLSPEELEHDQGLGNGINRIVLAQSRIDEELIAKLVAFCRSQEIKLSVVPPARGMFGTAAQLDHIADLPIVEYNTWDPSRSTLALKRGLDVLVSLTALLLLSPLLVLIAIAIALESRGPILFAQRRAGLHGRPFRLYKFRTMVMNAEELLPRLVSVDDLPEPVFKLRNDPRVTRVGRALRRLSLDELPQLWNVLRGAMSLVGPRPEELDLVDRYAPEHRFRLSVKPGITGPMQVFGRGELGLHERLAVEREYIENLSLARDFRIMALTLAAVFNGRGAY